MKVTTHKTTRAQNEAWYADLKQQQRRVEVLKEVLTASLAIVLSIVVLIGFMVVFAD